MILVPNRGRIKVKLQLVQLLSQGGKEIINYHRKKFLTSETCPEDSDERTYELIIQKLKPQNFKF